MCIAINRDQSRDQSAPKLEALKNRRHERRFAIATSNERQRTCVQHQLNWD